MLHSKTTKRIVYYISSHGFGHAARSLSVLSSLTNKATVFVKTKIPPFFFKGFLGNSIKIISQETDSGCIQKDFTCVDEEKTFKVFQNFMNSHSQRIEAEVNWLKQKSIDLIVSDAPSLPIEAAHRASIPSILVSNFTWYDIYSDFDISHKFSEFLEIIKEEYSKTTIQILPQCHIVNKIIKAKTI